MPITIQTTTSTVLLDKFSANVSAKIEEDKVEPEGSSLQSADIEQLGSLLNLEELAESSSSLTLSDVVERIVTLRQKPAFTDLFGALLLSELILETDVPLRLTTGPLLYSVDSEVIGFATLSTYTPFETLPKYQPLFLVEKTDDTEGTLILEEFVEVSGTVGLTLVDVIGPVIENELPTSGSIFNDPDTEITLDLVDVAAGISQSTIQLYINSYQVVENGAAVSPSGYGQSFFTKVTDNLYQLQFIKDDPFDLYETVTISGVAEDSAVPVNSGNYLYTFRTWDLEDINATISGGPDVEDPYLLNQSPFPGQINVDPNSNIVLELHDDHTGVSGGSVTLSVDGNIVVQSGNLVTDYANTVISGLSRGFRYEIDPIETLEFNQEVVVGIQASDSFIPPNSISGTYSFITTDDQHLVVSGFSVLVDGIYVPFYIAETHPTGEPTDFRVVYTDLTGSGIDTSNSTILHNGNTVSGLTFTPVVSGFTDSYYVDFQLTPNYFSESDLQFTVQQTFTGAVSGSIAPYKDVLTTLQWGYEICYDPIEDFDYDVDVRYCVRVWDRGYYPTQGAHCSIFSTKPLASNRLFAQIVGVQIDPRTLLTGLYESNNTFFEYGKTMNLEFEAEDYNGNKILTQWNFTIEEND